MGDICARKYLIIIPYLIVEISSQIHQKGTRDYCLLEKFNPQCKENEVILIASSIFGRMKANPCISRDTGPIGCFVDVKEMLEGFCSGRRSCDLVLSDPRLLATRPCRNNFDLYITVSYICVTVDRLRQTCNGHNTSPAISDNGYIASSDSEATRNRNSQCPLKIKSKDGQQLNVTIQRFSTSSSQDKSSNPPVCHSAATVKEDTTIKNVLLCPSDAKNKSIYISLSDQIEVSFPSNQKNEETVYLIHYQATGCAKPTIPKGTHFKRTGDHARVTCNDTKAKVSWELICKENQWQGEEKSCSGAWTFASTMNADEAPPLGMLLIIVTGIALGVLIGGFLLYLAINAFKRYHGLLPGQQIQNPSYEKPFYNPNNKLAGYNDRTIQRSSMIYGTQRRSYPNRQMPPPVPPPHADNAQIRPPSEISECNRQSHIYETPLFNSL